MALGRDQVALIFRIEADSTFARKDFGDFERAVQSGSQAIERNTERSFRRVGESAQSGTRIAREAFTTLTSEVIEGYGVDGDIANELAKMFAALPVHAKLGLAGVAAAFIAAAGAAAALVLTTKQMIDVAGEVGTKSKEDFDEFAKRVKSAGGEVTALDRAMSQELIRSVDMVRGATDELFIKLLRESGPELITLLQTVANELHQIGEAAPGVGHVLGLAFSIATASLVTLNQTLILTGRSLALLLSGDKVKQAQGIAAAIQAAAVGDRFDQNLQNAIRGAAGIKPPNATFDSKGSKDSLNARLALLREEQRAVELAANAEIELADRMFKEKSLFAEDYLRISVGAEEEILRAKLQTIEAEGREIEASKRTAEEKRATLAKLKNDAIQAEQQTALAIAKIKQTARDEEKKRTDEELKGAQERDKERLAQLRNFLRARNELLEIAQRRQQDQLDREARTLEDRARNNPAFRQSAISARRAAELNQLENERARQRAVIKSLELEVADLEDTDARKIAVRKQTLDALIRLQLEYDARRHQIEEQGRAAELAPAFGESAAQAIAVVEQALERQATAWERSRIALQDYTAALQTDLQTALANATDFLGLFTDASFAAIDAFINSGGSLKAAGKAFAKAMIDPFIEIARVAAKFYAAKAIASAAALDFRGAVLYGLAAAGMAALGAIGAALVSSGSAGGGAAASFNRANESSRSNERRAIEQGDRQRPEPQVIIIRAEHAPGVVIDLIEQDYRSNGRMRAVVRRDVLGEA